MNLYRQLDRIPLRDVERWRARAQLERARYMLDLMTRSSRAVSRGFRAMVLRPLKRARLSIHR
jgi:hypothetical protein